MSINRWQDVKVEKVSDVVRKAADYNPRKITPEAKEKLRFSLNKFGLVMPLVINDRTNNLVSGHQRLAIAHEDGEKEILVLHVDVDPVTEKEMNIALNSRELTGDFDEERLAALFEEIFEESEQASKEVKFLGEELLDDLVAKGFEFNVDFLAEDDQDLLNSIDDLLVSDGEEKEVVPRGPRNRSEETEETESLEEEHSEKREAQIRKIARDQTTSANQKYLRCKVGVDELDTILLAVEEFDQSLVPETYNTGDPLGNFLFYCVMFYQAHGRVGHYDNPLEE